MFIIIFKIFFINAAERTLPPQLQQFVGCRLSSVFDDHLITSAYDCLRLWEAVGNFWGSCYSWEYSPCWSCWWKGWLECSASCWVSAGHKKPERSRFPSTWRIEIITLSTLKLQENLFTSVIHFLHLLPVRLLIFMFLVKCLFPHNR